MIEAAFRIPGHPEVDAWVSLDDAHHLIQDGMVYGDIYVREITDRDPEALVTHERIPPPLARKWERA